MEFKDKTVLVTGAARGIGQSIALRFASAGANLALCDLKAEWCEETAAAATEKGVRVESYSVDVSNGEQVTDAVKKIKEDFGTIDSLVNNAGITKDGLLIRMSDADWQAVIDVNLTGAFLFTREVGKIMMKQRSGTMVNIASVIGLMGNPGQINYAASKAGVIALTKTTAKELASRGVRANAVAPGFIATAMTEKLSDKVQQAMLDVIPLKEFGQPDDVSNVVFFLASEQSRYVTGQTISICGGMVTH